MPVVKKKVVVAMSGGVDSSVAAALLKKATPNNFAILFGRPTPQGFRGYDVSGVHIKMWSDPDIPCNFKEDRYDAMRVCAHLDIPFQTWDLTAEYRAAVVDYMIRGYAAGQTPNPDVMCNREIKFGVFLKKVLASGADYTATGHYARVAANGEGEGGMGGPTAKRYTLSAGLDQNKDQSYFLWTLGQEALAHTLFPVGEYTKPDIRALAKEFGLPTAEKEESQGICFIGEIDLKSFLKKYIPAEAGAVVTTSGRAIGQHDGAAFYTIGQRGGIGIGGGIPYYVTAKNLETNTLVVGEGPHDAGLFGCELAAAGEHWISGRAPSFPIHCQARIRYRQPLQACTVSSIKYQVSGHESIQHEHQDLLSDTGYTIHIRFDEPQRAITPGQSIVFYDRERVLGGAVIRR